MSDVASPTPAANPAGPAVPVITGRRRTIALWVVLLAFFMDILDTTVVNVAIPSIQGHLGASYAAIQWIIAGYSLTFALFLITGGRLGDIFGYRTLFLVGMAGFTLASAACGIAPTTEILIGARLVQGFMAAMMVPQILSTIQVMYTRIEERQGVSAFYGATAGVATVAGPIVGGLLVGGDLWGLGWRAIFLVNVPVGIVALVLSWIYLPKAKSPHPLRLDLLGVALILVAMLLLMYPLIQGRELDWPFWAFVAMAASLPAFFVFGWSQVTKDRRDGSPLVVPHLFTHRSFVAGLILSGSFFAVVTGYFLVFTLFVQVGMGYSVLKAGLTGIPFSIGVSLAAGLSGPVLVPKFGRNILTAGPILLAAGFLLFIVTVRLYGAGLTPWELIPALVVGGIGMGCVVASVYPFILAEVPIRDAGSASGIISATQQIGSAIGIAVVGVIFFGLIGAGADGSAASVRDELAADLTAAGIPAFAQPSILDGFETCFRDRTNAKDPLVLPESCGAAKEAQAAFAATQPEMAARVAAAVTARAAEANRLNFSAALEGTLAWEIGALMLLALLSFALPMRPKRREEVPEGGASA